jgi:CelD/BcsL family acetyltransferase involved in cellulose biosynthesis
VNLQAGILGRIDLFSSTAGVTAGSGRDGYVEADVERLEAEWEQLAEATSALPFLYPGWIRPWLQAFGRGTLQLVHERVDGRLVAVIPLLRRRGALHSPTNWHTPAFGLLAAGTSAAERLVRRVYATAERRLSLEFLDGDSAELDLYRQHARAAGYRVAVRTLERSPYVTVDGEWAAAQAELDGKLVRDLRRRRRRLDELGEVTLDVRDGRDHLDELLAEGLRLEGSGWKEAAGTAIASDPNLERFYREIAAWASGRGWLRLAFLRLDGRPLAFQFGVEHDRVYYFLKGGYDTAFVRFAPGKLLLHAMLERAFDTGLRSFELLGDAEPWKLEWTRSCRERVAFQAFAPSAAGSLEWLAHAYGRPLARSLRGARARLTSRRHG